MIFGSSKGLSSDCHTFKYFSALLSLLSVCIFYQKTGVCEDIIFVDASVTVFQNIATIYYIPNVPLFEMSHLQKWPVLPSSLF